jgi:hypothetical protein
MIQRHIRNIVRDESGMTMGLAVIMIVLIGVMGAGLLTFVQRDLGSVVEVNQGQKALEMADAGVEAARYHLAYRNSMRSNYDPVAPAGNSAWYDSGPGTGQELDIDGDTSRDVRVGIRYLLPSSTASQTRNPDYAPELLPNYGSDTCDDTGVSGGTAGDGIDDDLNPATGDVDACMYPNSRSYFRITVQGQQGEATRAVQAIIRTQNVDLPVAYYATRDITFLGTSTRTTDVSFFARGNIYNLRSATVDGQDFVYGDWKRNPSTGLDNGFNNVARGTTAAGVAALGTIDYQGTSFSNAQKSNSGSPQFYGRRDYDSESDTRVGSKEFVVNTWGPVTSQPSTAITFPFDTGNATEDATTIQALKTKARANGTYVRISNPDTNTSTKDHIITQTTATSGSRLYPMNSSLGGTVYFVEFAGGTDDAPTYGGITRGQVEYDVRRTANADGFVKGIIVVVNGDLETSSSAGSQTNGFQGAMVVRDENPDGYTSPMTYRNAGSIDINGFINVEGDIFLQGSVTGFLPGALVNGLPGLIDINLWSWRECYTATCN